MMRHKLYGAEAQAMALALATDKDECDECQRGTPVAHAAFTYISTEGIGVTFRCRSGCRWYNPATGQMEGRKHCTCDACW